MRLVDTGDFVAKEGNKLLAEGEGRVFWPDTRGNEPFLTITLGEGRRYVLFIEGVEELNELFKAFAPLPEEKYLDI